MRGSARVALSCRMMVPEFDSLGNYVGIVDLDSDRCRLDETTHASEDTDKQSMVFDGSLTYTWQADGRWTWTQGALGTHSMFHPRGFLDALVHAQTSAVAREEHVIELGLDHAALNAAADAGLSRDWTSWIAVAELSPGGTIARVTLTHRSRHDPDAWLRLGCAISDPGRLPAIELPAPDLMISLADYLEQRSRGANL
jgi:hypothetical protein